MSKLPDYDSNFTRNSICFSSENVTAKCFVKLKACIDQTNCLVVLLRCLPYYCTSNKVLIQIINNSSLEDSKLMLAMFRPSPILCALLVVGVAPGHSEIIKPLGAWLCDYCSMGK